jgi:tRNA pseudouridine55 synthase
MDGLINLHKPLGLTSTQALYRVRDITGQPKSGHAASLDPAAEGVLLVCLGRGTKLVEALMNLPKVYRATARLDLTSPGHDSEKPPTTVTGLTAPAAEQLARVLTGFEGRIEQVPPALSAVKVGGRPAYKLSRRGRAPQLAARPVEVYWLHLRGYAWPRLEFDVACGRGTYIRALIRDIGAQLGTAGCLTSLVRLAVGPFSIETSWSLEALGAAAASPSEFVIPPERVLGLLSEHAAMRPARPSA